MTVLSWRALPVQCQCRFVRRKNVLVHANPGYAQRNPMLQCRKNQTFYALPAANLRRLGALWSGPEPQRWGFGLACFNAIYACHVGTYKSETHACGTSKPLAGRRFPLLLLLFRRWEKNEGTPETGASHRGMEQQRSITEEPKPRARAETTVRCSNDRTATNNERERKSPENL